MWFSKDECIFSEWLHACFQEGRFCSKLRYRKKRFRGRMKAAELMFALCFQPLLFSHSVMSDSVWPHGLQHARLPCPSPSAGVCSLMSIESVMPSNHLILCHPLLLLASIFPNIRFFSNELALHIWWPKYWSFSISPSNEYSGLISFRIDLLDLLAVQGTLKSLLQHHSSKASILWCSAFFVIQLSHPYMTTGKTIALTRWTFVSKVMSLLFNTLYFQWRVNILFYFSFLKYCALLNTFFKKIYLWLCWVFLAALGPPSVVASEGYTSVVMHGVLIAVVSLLVEHRLWASGLRYLWCVALVVVTHRLSCSMACGIFPDQGLNLHWQVDSLPLSHQRSPWICLIHRKIN